MLKQLISYTDPYIVLTPFYTHFLTVLGDYCTGQALNIKGGREVH